MVRRHSMWDPTGTWGSQSRSADIRGSTGRWPRCRGWGRGGRCSSIRWWSRAARSKCRSWAPLQTLWWSARLDSKHTHTQKNMLQLKKTTLNDWKRDCWWSAIMQRLPQQGATPAADPSALHKLRRRIWRRERKHGLVMLAGGSAAWGLGISRRALRGLLPDVNTKQWVKSADVFPVKWTLLPHSWVCC